MYDFLLVVNRHHSFKLLRFWENRVFCILTTDRQTDLQCSAVLSVGYENRVSAFWRQDLRWRISAILDFRGMGSLKSSCRDYISKLLRFWENRVFCILATDRQTNEQTNRWTVSIDALSRSRYRERRLIIHTDFTYSLYRFTSCTALSRQAASAKNLQNPFSELQYLTRSFSLRLTFGFIFDEHLTFSDQISAFSKSCYYHILEFRCIRRYLDWNSKQPAPLQRPPGVQLPSRSSASVPRGIVPTSRRCQITATSPILHPTVVPRHQLSSYGRRAFCVAGPSVWNSLPDSLRNLIIGANSFRQFLKTFLFETYWCI